MPEPTTRLAYLCRKYEVIGEDVIRGSRELDYLSIPEESDAALDELLHLKQSLGNLEY